MSSFFHGKTSVEGETSIKKGHDTVNGCTVLDARLGSSLGGSQPSVAIYTQEEQTFMTRAAITTQQTRDVLPSPPPPYDRVDELSPFTGPPPPYDGYHGSLTPNTGFQPSDTVQQHPLQRPRTLRRRPTRRFQRSLLPEHGMSQGNALQPEGESGIELNAAWKKQMREHRLTLNALCAARQQEGEATIVPNNGSNNGNDLSGFKCKYQEYLERRGLFEHQRITEAY